MMRPGFKRHGLVALVVVFVAALIAIWACYSQFTKEFASVERMYGAQLAAARVLTNLENQDAGIRNLAAAKNGAVLETYLAARQTFPSQLRAVDAALADPSLTTTADPLRDLRSTYQAWLTTVARPLAYTRLSKTFARQLQLRGTILMAQMRADIASMQSAISAAATDEHRAANAWVLAAAAAATLVVIVAFVLAAASENRRELAESERKLFSDTTNDLLCVADYSGRFVRVNQAWQKMLGYSLGDLRSRSFVDMVHPEDRGATAYEMYRLAQDGRVVGFRNRYRARDGAYHLMLWNAVRDEVARLIYVTARDETDHVRVETELQELSFADPLTGLPNRRSFVQQLQRAINMARRHRLCFWLLYFDVDELKDINDRLGHAAGDDALKGIVANISLKLRESDLFARVGGDEFAILTPPIAMGWDVEAMAQKVVEAACSPVEVLGEPMTPAISLGIASFPEDGNNANELLSAADTAMYWAKRAGGSRFAWYSASVREAPPSA